MPFETPPEPSGDVSHYQITLPSEVGFLSLYLGALSNLGEEWRWQQVGIEPIEAAAIFAEAITTVRKKISLIGTIHAVIQAVAPPGMLVCDGSTQNTADWPELYAVLPAPLQHGETFTLPDLRGRMLIPAGQGLGGVPNIPLYDVLTHETVTLSVDNLPPHNHSYNVATSIPTAAGELPTLASEVTVTPTVTGNAGSGTPVDIRPSHIGLLFVIVGKDAL